MSSVASLPWLPLWAEIVASILIICSGLLVLIGSIGLAHLPDFKRRIHAPTVGNSLGVFFLMSASALISWFMADRPFFHEALIVVFLFLTSPITSTLMMRSYILREQKGQR